MWAPSHCVLFARVVYNVARTAHSHVDTHGSRSCCLCKKIVSSPCVTHDVARAFIFILLLAHELSTFVSLSSSSSTTSTSQVTLPIKKNCDEPQNEEYGSVAKTTSSTGYEPNVIDNSDYSETFSRLMRNSTMSLSEKRHLHNCSLRSKKNQRTWDKLIILIKKVCSQLSPFSHEQVRWNPCTNQVQICLENGNQVATWKQANQDF